MPVIYKPLAEVMLLHEYYLTNSNGRSFFNITDPVQQRVFLRESFEKDIPSINELLDYVLPIASEEYIPSPFIRVVPSYGGFRVLAEVNEKRNTDGTISYTPSHPLPEGISIYLKAKSLAADAITNLRLQTNISSRAFFTNYDLSAPKSFPSLCNGVPLHQPGFNYEQGQLASFGTNDTRQFFIDKSGFNWKAVNGSDLAGESDRLLVPLKFEYHFNNDTTTTSTFILRSESGNTIKTISASGNTPLQNVTLDFTTERISTVPGGSSAIYTLDVEGNNGFSHNAQLVFLGQASEYRDCWGMVHLRPRANDSNYSLLDNEGFLKTKKDAGGVVINMPVFEIKMKSRFTYWRYENNRKKSLKETEETKDFLEGRAGRLVTRLPKELTFLPGTFKKNGTEFLVLPNPNRETMLRNESGRLYSDIIVHESPLFPVTA